MSDKIPSEIKAAAHKYATESFKTPIDAIRNSGLASHLQQGFIDGYSLASKTIDELRKELQAWKSKYSKAILHRDLSIAEQQKRIDELEKEKERLKKAEILRRYAGGKH
jgi:hypothetical protein